MSEEKKQTQDQDQDLSRVIAAIITIFLFIVAVVFFFLYSEQKEKTKVAEEEVKMYEKWVYSWKSRADSLQGIILNLKQKNKKLNSEITTLQDSIAVLDSLLSAVGPDSISIASAEQTDTTTVAPALAPKKLHWRDRLQARARTKK